MTPRDAVALSLGLAGLGIWAAVMLVLGLSGFVGSLMVAFP